MNQPLTPEQYEAKIAAMQAALAKIHDLAKLLSSGAAREICKVLSTLSDDIERGKELLGALQASRYNADVATQAVEEMKRQAVEIEEWKSRLTGYEHMAKVRRFYEVCATLTGKDLETVAELAAKMAEKNHDAMKEKP